MRGAVGTKVGHPTVKLLLVELGFEVNRTCAVSLFLLLRLH